MHSAVTDFKTTLTYTDPGITTSKGNIQFMCGIHLTSKCVTFQIITSTMSSVCPGKREQTQGVHWTPTLPQITGLRVIIKAFSYEGILSK